MKKITLIALLFLISTVSTIAQTSTVKLKESKATVDAVPTQVLPVVEFDSIHFAKSSEMLDEDLYWTIIANSLKDNLPQEDREIILANEVEKLSPKEIIGFRLRTDKLLYDTYTSNLWCAAFLMNDGTTDASSFDYFRCWLISQGKETFYKAVANPDSLVNLLKEGQTTYEFEGFWFVAMNAFLNKTNHEIYAYIDYDTFVTNDENYPLINFTWSVDEPKTMEKICPILFKKLWKK
ncbi:DUF4240 domain-containing protein [Flavobacterium sp. NG2]|uniref:DUF4240 domain-containing protein n=1 Tax=Flavobacterium sp. NG2 TaxID=3097547 RepID=UPI002A7F1CF5|nr:DUF4240 domain-containing protein [Flavobacterium sp. NG2]WPR70776.1 DUF4240 domain-containing protein [Flavobacterium sp. NG2]